MQDVNAQQTNDLQLNFEQIYQLDSDLIDKVGGLTHFRVLDEMPCITLCGACRLRLYRGKAVQAVVVRIM